MNILRLYHTKTEISSLYTGIIKIELNLNLNLWSLKITLLTLQCLQLLLHLNGFIV